MRRVTRGPAQGELPDDGARQGRREQSRPLSCELLQLRGLACESDASSIDIIDSETASAAACGSEDTMDQVGRLPASRRAFPPSLNDAMRDYLAFFAQGELDPMPQIEHEPQRSMSCELLRMQGLEPDDDAIAGPGGSDVEADASGGGGELGGQENITVSAVTPPLHRDKPAAHARSHTTGPGGARQDSAPDTERFMESFRLVMGTIAPAHLRAVRPCSAMTLCMSVNASQ